MLIIPNHFYLLEQIISNLTYFKLIFIPLSHRSKCCFKRSIDSLPQLILSPYLSSYKIIRFLPPNYISSNLIMDNMKCL